MAVEVLDAIRHAAGGETLVNAATLARMMGRRPSLERGEERPHLTEREIDVLKAMGEGLNTAQISERLAVTTATTRTYVQTILRKLDAHSRLQAVVRAKRFGLLR